MLPCDRAVAVQTRLTTARPPYTESVAHDSGWRWRIPLQHRVGNGYVYSSAHADDATAVQTLQHAVGAEMLTEPRILNFVTGRRRIFWHRNCVALGLASGFLEPLESTSIHLMVSGMYKLLEHFPDRSFDPCTIDSYNREVIAEVEHVRDFIVLHYALTRRADTPFWQHCRTLPLPDSLRERMDLYRVTGRIRIKAGELFTDASWFYIFEGMGVRPSRHDPMLDVVSAPELARILRALTAATAAAAQTAPSHDSYFGPPESAVRQAG
jgi:tryptophan halogenase